MSDDGLHWDLTASLDQAKQGLRDLSGVVHSYYEGLIEAGFTEKQALYLAASWLKQPEPPE